MGRTIVGLTHSGRQTALFSATWPDSVRELAHSFLKRPIKVTIGSEDLAAGTRITQIVEVVEERSREGKLTQLLKKYHADRKNRILIFVLYKKEASRIEQNLARGGWKGTSIHGDKSQAGRAGRKGTSHTFFHVGDKWRAGELVKVLKDAGQEVPEEMNQFDLNIKKKEHKLYGAFGPKDNGVPMKKASKITFDD